METVFPALLTYQHFMPIFLRIAVAAVLFYDAKKIWDKKQYKVVSVVELVLALMIGAGFLTQIAVVIAGVKILYIAWKKKYDSVFENKLVTLLMLAILLSLLVNGAGGFAFDLPY